MNEKKYAFAISNARPVLQIEVRSEIGRASYGISTPGKILILVSLF